MQKYEQDIEKLLAEGNMIQIKPRGYSMYPVLVPGRDEVIVAPVSVDETGEGSVDTVEAFRNVSHLKRGDVVLYRRDESILVLHRIWRKQGDKLYLVGDNQKEIEGPLRTDQMKGIMIGMVRKGKKISVKNPIYRVLTGIWLWMRPVRPVVSKAVAKVKRLGKGKR